jgi:putative endonuclease
MNTTAIGNKAEEKARTWLERNGWVCLEQNARTRFFELDLVMKDGDTTVFVEVKYRKSNDYGGGVGAISRDKQRRLIAGAQVWLAEKKLWDEPVRFDVMIFRETSSGVKLQHLKDCLWRESLW